MRDRTEALLLRDRATVELRGLNRRDVRLDRREQRGIARRERAPLGEFHGEERVAFLEEVFAVALRLRVVGADRPVLRRVRDQLHLDALARGVDDGGVPVETRRIRLRLRQAARRHEGRVHRERLRTAERRRIRHRPAGRDRRIAHLFGFKIRHAGEVAVVTQQIDHHTQIAALTLGRLGDRTGWQNTAVEARRAMVGGLVVKSGEALVQMHHATGRERVGHVSVLVEARQRDDFVEHHLAGGHARVGRVGHAPRRRIEINDIIPPVAEGGGDAAIEPRALRGEHEAVDVLHRSEFAGVELTRADGEAVVSEGREGRVEPRERVGREITLFHVGAAVEEILGILGRGDVGQRAVERVDEDFAARVGMPVLHGIFPQGGHAVVAEPFAELELVGERHALHFVLRLRGIAELIGFEIELAGAGIGDGPRAARRWDRQIRITEEIHHVAVINEGTRFGPRLVLEVGGLHRERVGEAMLERDLVVVELAGEFRLRTRPVDVEGEDRGRQQRVGDAGRDV